MTWQRSLPRLAFGTMASMLSLAHAPSAWAWGVAPGAPGATEAVVAVPIRIHAADFFNHQLSLGLQPIFYSNAVLGPSGLGGAAFQDRNALVVDADLRLARKHTLFRIPLGPLGALAPTFTTYGALRTISAATLAMPSAYSSPSTPQNPNAPPPIPIEDRIPPPPDNTPGLVGHNLYGGVVAGSEASIEMPLGFSFQVGGSITSLLLGTWERRTAGFFGLSEAYWGDSQRLVGKGFINAFGVVLPGGSIGLSWGPNEHLQIGLRYELMTLPSDLRAQHASSFALNKNLSSFSFAHVDVRFVDFTF